VTYLRCGGTFKHYFVANLPLSLPVKEFWKSVNVWGSYGQEFSVLFFDSRYRKIHKQLTQREEKINWLSPVFIQSIFGWGSPPKKTWQFLPTAAKLCALNLFFDRGNEFQIYHKNILLINSIHTWKLLFVSKQSKWCKFMPKIHQIRLAVGLSRNGGGYF